MLSMKPFVMISSKNKIFSTMKMCHYVTTVIILFIIYIRDYCS